MRKEREQAAKASEQHLQSIMSELCALMEKQDRNTNERKVGEKTLLDNIKASIDPILKSNYKSGKQIGIGAHLKHLQEEVTYYFPPTGTKNTELPSLLTTPLVTLLLVDIVMTDMCIGQALLSNQKLVTST